MLHFRYTDLLESRYKSRLKALEKYKEILSMLSSNKVPKSAYGPPVRLRSLSGESDDTIKSRDRVNSSAVENQTMDSSKSPSETHQSDDAVNKAETVRPFQHYKPPEDLPPPPAPNTSIISQKSYTNNMSMPNFGFFYGAVNPGKIRDVFLEIVDMDDVPEEDEDIKLSERKLFWKQMSELNEGTLKLSTYNGICVISKRKQAKIFAQKLYLHLSRKGLYQITAKIMRDLIGNLVDQSFEKNRASVLKVDEVGEKKRHREYKAELLKFLNELFILSTSDEGIVTEVDIQNGVMTAYKEMAFASSSLNDFGALQVTLRYIIGGVFWVVMLIVFQCIVQINLTAALAPVITFILILSFALGPFFGNTFLAIAFVLFMLPFDIGNRVTIGSGTNTISCYITGINLFYTTVESMLGEKVIICFYLE